MAISDRASPRRTGAARRAGASNSTGAPASCTGRTWTSPTPSPAPAPSTSPSASPVSIAVPLSLRSSPLYPSCCRRHCEGGRGVDRGAEQGPAGLRRPDAPVPHARGVQGRLRRDPRLRLLLRTVLPRCKHRPSARVSGTGREEVELVWVCRTRSRTASSPPSPPTPPPTSTSTTTWTSAASTSSPRQGAEGARGEAEL